MEENNRKSSTIPEEIADNEGIIPGEEETNPEMAMIRKYMK